METNGRTDTTDFISLLANTVATTSLYIRRQMISTNQLVNFISNSSKGARHSDIV